MLATVKPSGSWDRLQSSRAYKHHEEQLGYAALCVIGTFDRQPRSFGDNQGVHPSRLVVTTVDPRKAPEVYNRGVHSVGALYHTRAYVWWKSKEHAGRAKEWIEQQVGGEELLNHWYSVEPWQWEIMFNEASIALGLECFDESEKQRRIWERAKKG